MLTRYKLGNIMKFTRLPESDIDTIYGKILLDNEISSIIELPYTYTSKDIEAVSKCALFINNLYERSGELNTKFKNYFNDRYNQWITLVLETEDGKIYRYTRHNIIMAYRAFYAHKNKNMITPKITYLNEFLKKSVTPNILYYDIGHTVKCVRFEHHCEEILQEDFKFDFGMEQILDIQESFFFGIIEDILHLIKNEDPIKTLNLYTDLNYLESRCKNKDIPEKLRQQIKEVYSHIKPKGS